MKTSAIFMNIKCHPEKLNLNIPVSACSPVFEPKTSSPHLFETSSLESCAIAHAETQNKGIQDTGWYDYFASLFIDCSNTIKTFFLRLQACLGLGTKLAIPSNHPSKRQIQELTNLGGLLWPNTLDQCLHLIQQQYPHIHIDTTFLHTLVTPNRLDPMLLRQAPADKSLVLIPFFLKLPGGNHFTIACVDLLRKTTEYYDSEGNSLAGNAFLYAISNLYFAGNPRAKILWNKDRTQWDMHNCGVHVLDFSLKRALGEKFETVSKKPTSTSDIEKLRIQFAKDLLSPPNR